MKAAFAYCLLRYVHDIARGEFVNVGIALCAPHAKFASAICASNLHRVKAMFPDADEEHLQKVLDFIQAQFDEAGERMTSGSGLAGQPGVLEVAFNILPQDDSSLQWSEANGGVTDDPPRTLRQLYARLIGSSEATKEKVEPAIKA